MKGSKGMIAHITQKHAKTLGLGHINAAYVLEHCVRRELTQQEVQATVDAIKRGLEPISLRVCTYDDKRIPNMDRRMSNTANHTESENTPSITSAGQEFEPPKTGNSCNLHTHQPVPSLPRFLQLCEVIIDHPTRGWCELHCCFCGANAKSIGQGRTGFMHGVSGVQRHLIHKHKHYLDARETSSREFVLDRCVRRELLFQEVQRLQAAFEVGQMPVVMRVHTPEGSIYKTKPIIDSTSYENDTESVDEDLVNNLDEYCNISQLGEVGLHDDVPILAFQADTHSGQKLWFEVHCPFCKGNSLLQGGKLRWLDLQMEMPLHIENQHADELRKMDFSDRTLFVKAFLTRFVPKHCKARLLSEEDVSTICSRQVDIPMKAIDTHPGAIPGFLQFPKTFQMLEGPEFLYPTVVLREDGKWVELRCPECGTNRTGNGSKFLQGAHGFAQHLKLTHHIDYDPFPDGDTLAFKLRWAIEKCSVWAPNVEWSVDEIVNDSRNIEVIKQPASRDDTRANQAITEKKRTQLSSEVTEEDIIHTLQPVAQPGRVNRKKRARFVCEDSEDEFTLENFTLPSDFGRREDSAASGRYRLRPQSNM
jgi:hypothetical protein